MTIHIKPIIACALAGVFILSATAAPMSKQDRNSGELPPFYAQLALTAEQTTAYRDHFSNLQARHDANQNVMRELRQQLNTLTMSADADEAQITALVQKISELKQAHLLQTSIEKQALWQILSPEQQKKAQALKLAKADRHTHRANGHYRHRRDCQRRNH